MSSIGLVDRNDGVYPDLVFELDLRPAEGAGPRGAGEGRVIGIGVMTYRGWRNDKTSGDLILARYIEQMVHVITWLVQGGHSIRLMIGEDSDLDTLRRIHDAADARIGSAMRPRIEAAPADTLQQLAREMVGVDVVIATRYHNVICALSCGVPTISIGYSKKNDAVMADFGLTDACQHIDALDVALLKRQVETTLNELPERRVRVASRLEAVRARLHGQSDRIRQFILSVAKD